jgi:uncharacterized membrane protein
MRIASIGHAVFAVIMIVLGAVGLLRPDFGPLWNPVPANVPARKLLVYLSALISVASGVGLLVQRMATLAALTAHSPFSLVAAIAVTKLSMGRRGSRLI